MSPQPLPIDEALPDLIAALRDRGQAVLQAPPGAGKTTRVPLAMLEAGLAPGRIVMLEPRRLAVRAAAQRMAQSLGEDVGQTVGYRIRGESRASKSTRIEVVTEGILTRMIQSDPELSGISAVIFDEFHERSLNADLGLALTLELRAALRDDLTLLVMSATLDTAPVAALMGDAPVITSQGRAYPVETRWRDRPLGRTDRLEPAVADTVTDALANTTGGILVFLPGEAEIRRTAALLAPRLPDDCQLRPLYGAMPFAEQQQAIQPVRAGRKIVLATSIAETSLTIQDIRCVVDAGRARRARFDPGTGMSRLVTERVTRAEAEQRRGRAGRVAEGWCYRLWTKGEEGGLTPHPPAEIEAADLTGLALELAQWGAPDPDMLPFLTAPNPGAFAEAQTLLTELGALDDAGRITDHGRTLAALPTHPRLAHMLAVAGSCAAPLAAILSDRDPLGRGAPVDLGLRLEALADLKGFHNRRPFRADRGTIERLKTEARRLELQVANLPEGGQSLSPGAMAALAYPDRIGLRRKGDAPRWVLSGGTGAIAADDDPMAGARLIVALNLDGNRREARIRLAAEISEAELRDIHGDRITRHEICDWSKRDRRVIARQQERLGALVLSERNWRDVPGDAVRRAALEGIRDLGLPVSAAARRLIARAELVRDRTDALPDLSLDALNERLDDWLLPHLPPLTTADQIRGFDILDALRAQLDWSQIQRLGQLAPDRFETPLGRHIPIDYAQEVPTIEVRLQEMFGVTEHPRVGARRIPIRISLLSPAGRPVQVTTDLPGFWASSYADVRKDMRGRYPKHPWPENPRIAVPTLRAKPRKS